MCKKRLWITGGVMVLILAFQLCMSPGLAADPPPPPPPPPPCPPKCK